ncbi:flagellar hook-length control protein FliK [Piscinibacter sp.]|uniref:flagellar hook-length control protein FliK n=1 Tax=Piscinibacter sp. TaxID=1903157 RepID=UPI0039E3A682
MGIPRVETAKAPSQAPARSEAAASGEGEFAQLMALQAPPEAPPSGPAPPRGDDARQARSREAAKTVPRDETAAEADATEAAPAAAEHTDAKPADDATTDPDLAQWLAQWHGQPPADETVAAPPAATKKRTAADTAGIEATDKATATQRLRGGDEAARERGAAIDAPALPARDETAAATPEPTRAAGPAASAGTFTLPAGFVPVSHSAAATAVAAPAPAAADASVLGVPVPVPLDSPEFATAFGVEISLLAKGGVQRAELHLNPAETGPVSVRIALDGQQARIDFGAQAAATRAAIEASLPELAAALRDAGLTLAGGGVTQHMGQHGGRQGDERRDAPADGPRLEGDAGTPAAPARAAWRGRAGASGVDLYA